MSDDDSYRRVSATEEAIGQLEQAHDHPKESSETHTVAGPEVEEALASTKQNGPTVVRPSYYQLPKV